MQAIIAQGNEIYTMLATSGKPIRRHLSTTGQFALVSSVMHGLESDAVYGAAGLGGVGSNESMNALFKDPFPYDWRLALYQAAAKAGLANEANRLDVIYLGKHWNYRLAFDHGLIMDKFPKSETLTILDQGACTSFYHSPTSQAREEAVAVQAQVFETPCTIRHFAVARETDHPSLPWVLTHVGSFRGETDPVKWQALQVSHLELLVPDVPADAGVRSRHTKRSFIHTFSHFRPLNSPHA